MASQQKNSAQDKSESSNLEEQIQQNKEQSIDYQLIDKLLSKKDHENENINKNEAQNVSTERASVDNIGQDSVTFTEQSIQIAQQQSLSITQSTSPEQVNLRTVSVAQMSVSMSSNEADTVQQTDPLALDLNGDGIKTTGVENGYQFDIDGDGRKEQTSFVTGGDAFLAYDKNGNGLIDNGKELFGDQNGQQHGFAELARYDDNLDGKINAQDAIYKELKLLTINNNKQQLTSLSDSHIAAIHLNYRDENQAINQYDQISQVGRFDYKNGESALVADILVGHKRSK